MKKRFPHKVLIVYDATNSLTNFVKLRMLLKMGMRAAMDKVRHMQEWLKQAEYDRDTAYAMLTSKRYIYCVFMCHLALEKALKGLCVKRLDSIPPKTHSLLYLVQKAVFTLSNEDTDFLEDLDAVSIPTRYPEQLDKLLGEYTEPRCQTIYRRACEVIECIQQECSK